MAHDHETASEGQFLPVWIAQGPEECRMVSVVEQYQAHCDSVLVCERF